MLEQPRSIAEHIECLARLTGAPIAFVDQVRALFLTKGISLDTVADPFIEALEEAFRREEHIRNSTYRARQNLTRLAENFKKVGRVYVEQLAQVERSGGKSVARRAPRRAVATSAAKATAVTIKGDHRTYVTRTEREELPLVPGPSELQ